MSIPTNEQETVVQYGRNGETMTIYTSDSTQMTRLDKITAATRNTGRKERLLPWNTS